MLTEHICWRLFQKCALCTKFNIYILF